MTVKNGGFFGLVGHKEARGVHEKVCVWWWWWYVCVWGGDSVQKIKIKIRLKITWKEKKGTVNRRLAEGQGACSLA